MATEWRVTPKESFKNILLTFSLTSLQLQNVVTVALELPICIKKWPDKSISFPQKL